MQTFLPYPDFLASAQVLDKRRCIKQVVEAAQILRCLRSGNPKAGWRNHPAVRMWRGYEQSLTDYYNVFFWTCVLCHGVRYSRLSPEHTDGVGVLPPWIGNDSFHASHRSNLLRKDPVWYGQFGWLEPAALPYVWPVAKEQT